MAGVTIHSPKNDEMWFRAVPAISSARAEQADELLSALRLSKDLVNQNRYRGALPGFEESLDQFQGVRHWSGCLRRARWPGRSGRPDWRLDVRMLHFHGRGMEWRGKARGLSDHFRDDWQLRLLRQWRRSNWRGRFALRLFLAGLRPFRLLLGSRPSRLFRRWLGCSGRCLSILSPKAIDLLEKPINVGAICLFRSASRRVRTNSGVPSRGILGRILLGADHIADDPHDQKNHNDENAEAHAAPVFVFGVLEFGFQFSVLGVRVRG
jgi:hypothetical protein